MYARVCDKGKLLHNKFITSNWKNVARSSIAPLIGANYRPSQHNILLAIASMRAGFWIYKSLSPRTYSTSILISSRSQIRTEKWRSLILRANASSSGRLLSAMKTAITPTTYKTFTVTCWWSTFGIKNPTMAPRLHDHRTDDTIHDRVTRSPMATCGPLIMVVGRTSHFPTDLNQMISGDEVNMIFARVETDSEIERRAPPPR